MATEGWIINGYRICITSSATTEFDEKRNLSLIG